MELSLVIVFSILIILCLIVAIDQYNTKTHTLGSEWDFTRTDFTPKRIDTNK